MPQLAKAAAKQLDTNSADKLRAGVSNVLQSTKPPKGNLPSHLHRAATELCKDRDIVILAADKGNVSVIMDKKKYTEKLEHMLRNGTYSKLSKNPITSVESKVTRALKKSEK